MKYPSETTDINHYQKIITDGSELEEINRICFPVLYLIY